jgi:hypothetical protein
MTDNLDAAVAFKAEVDIRVELLVFLFNLGQGN